MESYNPHFHLTRLFLEPTIHDIRGLLYEYITKKKNVYVTTTYKIGFKYDLLH